MGGYSLEFILKGSGSDIRIFLPKPIIIHENSRASIGLKNFSTYNNITNIEKGRNSALKIKVPGTSEFTLVELETGAYELDTILKAIYDFIEQKYPSLKNVREDFKLIANEATSKCTIMLKGEYGIDFNVSNSICSVLGYDKSDIFKGTGRYTAKNIVMISTTSQLLFNCNIVESSYCNNIQIPLIYNCVIDVPAGYRLAREIHNISYKRLNTRQISNIHLWLTNESGAKITLKNDLLIVTLSLSIENG